jgi:hypothetical protein
MGKRVAVGLIAVLAGLGLKFYDRHARHASSQEIQAHLTTLCAGDALCARAVASHFEACFEPAYKTGGRHASSRIEGAQLVDCLNTRAGTAYFTYDASKE